ncbi:MAG: hypothetical protein FJ042_06725 [Candidatus Cloacimonetes bacterium]|nr:hypothetical protein [Candidatus Cloacimonadota bacterium]
MKTCLCLLVCMVLGIGVPLIAQDLILSDLTPAATALNGLTLLCESPTDNLANPVTAATGSTTHYINPFSLNKVSVYGLHTAQWIYLVKTAAGTVYLHSSDYKLTDYYVNFAFFMSDITIGYTHHFIFHEVEEDIDYESGDDFALRYDFDTGMAETIHRISKDEKEWLINALWRVFDDLDIAGGIRLEGGKVDCYRIGYNFQFEEVMSFLTSWQSDPSRFGFGVKLCWEDSDFTYAVRTHNELKLTHAVEFGYRW